MRNGIQHSGSFSTVPIELEFSNVGFCEGGINEEAGEKHSSKDENQHQI